MKTKINLKIRCHLLSLENLVTVGWLELSENGKSCEKLTC